MKNINAKIKETVDKQNKEQADKPRVEIAPSFKKTAERMNKHGEIISSKKYNA